MFRAYDARRERLVAVKVFRLDVPPERVHQLVAEFEQLIAADMNHPAMAVPLATGITGVSAYLAQDYVAAESLDLAVREYGAAPPADALRVAAQLAGALDLAAAANVNHGALHPRDVLLSDDETRLTGIGVARALERVGVAPPVRRPYTPPERRSNGAWDRRADVYSLAALVHELLWGKRVAAEGGQVADTLTDLPGARLEPLRTAFARALAEHPDDRFESALEFAEALKDAFPDVQLSEPPPSSRKRAQPPRQKEFMRPLPLDEPGPVEPDAARLEAAQPMPPEEVAEPLEEPLEHFDPQAPPAPIEPLEPLEPLEPRSLEPVEPPAPFEPLAPPEPLEPHVASSVLEQTRSAIWPLMAALVIGLAIGFAGGYGVGSTRDRTVATTNEVQVPLAVPAATTPSAASGRDATEIAVAPKPGDVASNPPAPRKPAAVPEKRSTPAPERRSASRAQPERQVPRSSERSAAPAPAGTSGAFVGRLSVDSRPTGARVFLDNKQIGVTPFATSNIKAGEHAIRIERAGYRHWTSTVRIVAGEQNRITASLDRP